MQEPLRLRERRAGHDQKQHNRADKYPRNHVLAKPLKSMNAP
jgi:hypothetical protein